MGDLYQVYNLPPPPPPTFLSFYNGPDRARLPNFLDSADPVGAARQHLHSQIMFLAIPSIWTQVKVVTGLIGLILVAAVAVIVRRLVQRSLWFLRVKSTDRGPMIVPNAIMTFAASAGLFAIVFLALINKIYVAWVIEDRPLKNFIIWVVVTWSPLISGPIWSSFGTWHARPPSSTPRSRGPPTFCGIRIWIPHSILISLFWLSVPFMVLFSVLGFGIKGNNYREQGVSLYYDWLDRYSNATTLTRPMLLELQDIWAHDLRAFYWLAIAMLVWSFWTVILFFAYTYVSFRLLIPLRAQLAALRIRNERKINALIEDDHGHGAAAAGLDGPGTRRADEFDAFKHPSDIVKLPLESPRLRSPEANFSGGTMDNVVFEKGDEDNGVDRHWGVNVKDLQVDTPHRSFFPPVKPSAVVRPATDSETSERYLRTAYKHFLFQACTVTLAIVYFCELTIYLALTVYTYNEQRKLGRAVDIAFIQAMWGSTFFGTCIFVSITLRTYEPMPVNQVQVGHGYPDGVRQSWSAQTSAKMIKMLNLRQYDPKQSLSFSQGATTLTASPTPTPKLPPLGPLNENSATTDQNQSEDGRARRFKTSAAVQSTEDEEKIRHPLRFLRIDKFLPKTPSALPKAPVSAVHLLEEEPASIVQPWSSQNLVTTNKPIDHFHKPVPTQKASSNASESSAWLNDGSLREMPSRAHLQRCDSAFSPYEYAGARAEPDRHLLQDERDATASPSAFSSREAKPSDHFVSNLRGASPSSEDERVREVRFAFVRDMLGPSSKTPLPPPPRQSRQPYQTS
ncbi:hypothetical protein OC846_005182 [Tilletia horrida]|uniref:Uncharacterized protein n=1 Tax=Tilletia horrida TaxID=155126 RepID=A0AAN6GLA8_9BASI|nr:hypothetical protein OC845_005693 [Tilletia horrida]KAK0546633.1 hypothetical protein OC846_005182 [Tilletia horrida]KAK0562460.1 hypothetical protein OC861_005301 [Tilletia horrida]